MMPLGDRILSASRSLPWKVSFPIRRALGTLPDFLLVGFPKCGTTSLYNYLIQHPQVLQGDGKEQWYFSTFPLQHLDSYTFRYPYRFDKWLAQKRGNRLLCGDASPDYIFRESSVKHFTNMLPDVQVIVLLRNPVERSFSYYQHERRAKRVRKSFADLVDYEYNSFREKGILFHEDLYDHPQLKDTFLLGSIYIFYIRNLLKYLPQERILFLKSEELFSHPDMVFQNVCQFLGIERNAEIKFNAHNVGNYSKDDIPSRSFLEQFYLPFDKELASLTGFHCL